MKDNQHRRQQMFMRVKDFGGEHANDFTAGGLGSQLFVDLAAIVSQLEAHASTQDSGVGMEREGRVTRSVAREALRDTLEAISRTARALAEDTPGINEKFRMPRGNNDQILLNAARAFKADAATLSAQFIAHELPADFLTGLNSDIADMEAAVAVQSRGVLGHASARIAIDETIDSGMVIVRKLDAIVRNRYANNPVTLAEWTTASHTQRGPRHSPPASPPPQGAGAGHHHSPNNWSARILRA